MPLPRDVSRLHRWLLWPCLGGILFAGGYAVLSHRAVKSVPQGTRTVASRPAVRSIPAQGGKRSGDAAQPPAEVPRVLPPGWEANWRRLLEQPDGTERAAEMAAALRELTAADPEAADRQLLALHPTDRTAVVAAALADAAQRTPDDAIREAIRFCDEDPTYSLEYGRSLISILGDTGHYRSALNFVLAEDSDGGLGENGSKWLTGLFETWAKAVPAQAAQEALAASPGFRGEALQAVAGAWVKSDPVALANFAWQLPADANRGLMLDAALRGWTEEDPVSAAAWIQQRPPGRELDAGLAALAARFAGDGRRPEMAIRWAGEIVDSTLRAGTLAAVVRYWAGMDRSAATEYVMASPGLQPEERTMLLNELNRARPAY
jgi:hypothetical protein